MKNLKPAKGRPLIVRDGAAEIKIYLTPTDTGIDNFTLYYSFGGKAVRRRFKDLDRAITEASETVKDLGRRAALADISSAEIERMVAAKNRVFKETGKNLGEATSDYCRAVKILGKDDNLVEAVRFYVKRLQKINRHVLVKDVFNEFIDAKIQGSLSERYILDLKKRLRKLVEYFDTYIENITTDDLNKFLNSLKLGPRNKNNYVGVFRTFFQFAIDRNYLPSDWNELRGVEKSKVVVDDIEIFTPYEMELLLNHCHDYQLPFLALGAFAGIRTAELFRMDWTMINWPSKTISIPKSIAKLAQRRIIPMHENLVQWLIPHRLPSGSIVKYKALKNGIASLCNQLSQTKGINLKWRHNGLRHSYI